MTDATAAHDPDLIADALKYAGYGEAEVCAALDALTAAVARCRALDWPGMTLDTQSRAVYDAERAGFENIAFVYYHGHRVGSVHRSPDLKYRAYATGDEWPYASFERWDAAAAMCADLFGDPTPPGHPYHEPARHRARARW